MVLSVVATNELRFVALDQLRRVSQCGTGLFESRSDNRIVTVSDVQKLFLSLQTNHSLSLSAGSGPRALYIPSLNELLHPSQVSFAPWDTVVMPQVPQGQNRPVDVTGNVVRMQEESDKGQIPPTAPVNRVSAFGP